jgi:aspartyl-tRNA(Asn)/glutamyl-tRNA(Gln) amidotransferase subunit A
MKNSYSLKEAIDLLRKKNISSVELTEILIKNIKNNDKNINAFVSINENALEDAKRRDKEKNGGSLKGIPLVFKDNFLTKGLNTTASSKLLDEFVPTYNSTVVQKLLNEGAFILGKTNMDAWAHGSSTETSDYGSTKNPWNLEHLPGGSSGGSAAAVVSDMAIAAIGSETAGSIRQPSAWSGCVGLKPTYGRVSRYGVIAMGSSLDSPGPMTKTVEDAAILLQIIAGKDPYDSTTSENGTERYSDSIGKEIKGMKIGIVKEYLLSEMRKDVKDLIIRAAKEFEGLGAKVEYVSAMDPHFAVGVYTIIQRSEVSSNLSRYDGIRYGKDRSYFGEEAKRRIMLGTFALSEGYSEKYYKNALKVRTLYIRDFEKIFKNYDLLMGPTSPGPAKKIGVSKGADMFGEMEDILIEPSTIAGLPGISLPCGFVDGLPIGLDIFGPQFSETKIIKAADAYEKVTEWHNKKPKLE